MAQTPSAFDPSYNGGSDGWLALMSMLPTGADRYGSSTPGCFGTIPIHVTSMPQVGNQGFAIFCSNTLSRGNGTALIGFGQRTAPLSVLGAAIWVDSIQASISLTANSRGIGELALPIPNDPALASLQLFTQFAWADSCAAGGIAASWPLHITVQP